MDLSLHTDACVYLPSVSFGLRFLWTQFACRGAWLAAVNSTTPTSSSLYHSSSTFWYVCARLRFTPIAVRGLYATTEHHTCRCAYNAVTPALLRDKHASLRTAYGTPAFSLAGRAMHCCSRRISFGPARVASWTTFWFWFLGLVLPTMATFYAFALLLQPPAWCVAITGLDALTTITQPVSYIPARLTPGVVRFSARPRSTRFHIMAMVTSTMRIHTAAARRYIRCRCVLPAGEPTLSDGGRRGTTATLNTTLNTYAAGSTPLNRRRHVQCTLPAYTATRTTAAPSTRHAPPSCLERLRGAPSTTFFSRHFPIARTDILGSRQLPPPPVSNSNATIQGPDRFFHFGLTFTVRYWFATIVLPHSVQL